ncbi:tRNA N(3)-methylcytidine methyltransferase METTL2-like isoform X3 [Dysidea avara]|uniref:tRNA N(3)-methylcytidine methyltransferase METTL2-like isoform X3 n=1 Tax=Dysidea avara TaxID=196820 RepID=UPI003329E719
MAEGDSSQLRPQFGNRLLTDPDKVFEHNAWFFKDRHWLFTEFPELLGTQVSCDHPSSHTNDTGDHGNYGGHENKHAQCATFRIFEVGCGAGNCVFPILQTSSYKELFIYCCDFAPSAVSIVKDNKMYDPSKCHVFLCDITDTPMPLPPPNSVDIVILIFVLSAISPHKMVSAVANLVAALKPGGLLLFRDYGCYDMAQLRFKPGKCLEKNFYVRGDGTRVYFFTKEEVSELFQKAGLKEEQLFVDRRLQVNRGKQLKMYRIWIQAKYRKPLLPSTS